jgi:hypothetical protein
MKYPLFSDPQFLDASAPGGLNPAFALVSGTFASLGTAAWAGPGLSAPEAMTVSFSGMVATIGLPSPWGLISSGGVIVRAHGTQTGMDTQTYSVNLAPAVARPVVSDFAADQQRRQCGGPNRRSPDHRGLLLMGTPYGCVIYRRREAWLGGAPRGQPFSADFRRRRQFAEGQALAEQLIALAQQQMAAQKAEETGK